jgi:hypothetical protein
MRKQIWIPCVIVLAICAWFLLRQSTKQETNASTGAIITNQPSVGLRNQPKQSEASAKPQSPETTNATKIHPRPTQAEISNLQQQALAEWQKPIEFYGKVVDERTNPVAGASVKFQWADRTENVTANTSTTESDTEGLFSLRGKKGRSLEVWVSKEGYYASHEGYKGFLYSLGNDIYLPDSQNPVIFNLRKKAKGESLVGSDFPGFAHIAQLHQDGTPVELDLFKGTRVSAGSGQLKLEFWRDISNKNANKFDWKIQLSVPNGGIVGTDEEFAFEAPKTGYQPSFVIDMPATNQVWLGELRTKYYIQLPNGNYGRIDFYLLPYNGVITVHSAINPSGSRNLEPAN